MGIAYKVVVNTDIVRIIKGKLKSFYIIKIS